MDIAQRQRWVIALATRWGLLATAVAYICYGIIYGKSMFEVAFPAVKIFGHGFRFPNFLYLDPLCMGSFFLGAVGFSFSPGVFEMKEAMRRLMGSATVAFILTAIFIFQPGDKEMAIVVGFFLLMLVGGVSSLYVSHPFDAWSSVSSLCGLVAVIFLGTIYGFLFGLAFMASLVLGGLICWSIRYLHRERKRLFSAVRKWLVAAEEE